MKLWLFILVSPWIKLYKIPPTTLKIEFLHRTLRDHGNKNLYRQNSKHTLRIMKISQDLKAVV